MRSLFFVVCFISGFVRSQEKFSELYVDSASFSDFEILADTLSGKRVYFTGENHMYATFNSKFELKFLRYLYETQNVRHFIFEQSPGMGYVIEKYTIQKKTSDKLYLKDQLYEPFFEMISGIAKFNDSLPAQEQIRFHGIDIERFPYFSIYALNDMVEELGSQFEGGEVFEQIIALYSSEFGKTGAEILYPEQRENFGFGFGEINGAVTLRSIISDSRLYRDSLSVALGEDSVLFWPIIESLELGIEWYNAERVGDAKSPIVREKFMQTEFERIYRLAEPQSKFFGQFGRCHTHKDNNTGRCYDFYVNSIANRIGEIDSTLAGQVMVLPIFYPEQKDYDGTIVKGLELKPEFLEEGMSYIIDLSYLPKERALKGYDGDLAFAVICNQAKDNHEEYNFKWEIPKTHIHLGLDYGYHYFRNLSGLNFELASAGAAEMPSDFIGYTYTLDWLRVREGAVKVAYTWLLPAKNGDRFRMGGNYFTVGGQFPFGKPWFTTAPGLNYGYGKMWLAETSVGSVPNLFQSGSQNKVLYRNDIMVLDPHVQIRISPRVFSFNAQAGYVFDISGKYWKLDSKLKDYRKTSFSGFYFQFGASIHLGITD